MKPVQDARLAEAGDGSVIQDREDEEEIMVVIKS